MLVVVSKVKEEVYPVRVSAEALAGLDELVVKVIRRAAVLADEAGMKTIKHEHCQGALAELTSPVDVRRAD